MKTHCMTGEKPTGQQIDDRAIQYAVDFRELAHERGQRNLASVIHQDYLVRAGCVGGNERGKKQMRVVVCADYYRDW